MKTVDSFSLPLTQIRYSIGGNIFLPRISNNINRSSCLRSRLYMQIKAKALERVSEYLRLSNFCLQRVSKQGCDRWLKNMRELYEINILKMTLPMKTHIL
jgi:hypothetical protein